MRGERDLGFTFDEQRVYVVRLARDVLLDERPIGLDVRRRLFAVMIRCTEFLGRVDVLDAFRCDSHIVFYHRRITDIGRNIVEFGE